MKYRDVIYPPIKNSLNLLKEKIEAKLLLEEDDKLSELSVELDDFIDKVATASSSDLERGCIDIILVYVSGVDKEHQFSSIDVNEFRRLKIMLHMAKVLEQDQNLDLNAKVDFPIRKFKVVVDKGNEVPFRVFGFYNADSKIDSIAFFNFKDSWMDKIQESFFNQGFLACSIYALVSDKTLNFTDPYIIVRKDAKTVSSIQAALRLQAVANSVPIHSPVSSSVNSSGIASSLISAIQPYQQFNESILILSEFHSHQEILNKFLSLYHVVESFMYKVPIVELSNRTSGKMFSIRNFKSLYKRIDMFETEAIQGIFKIFWTIDLSGHIFKDLVIQAFLNVRALPQFDEAESNEFLSNIGINQKFSDLQNNISAQAYSNLIYKVRCAIVHNSETEFHISHFNLSDTVATLIDFLLIEVLEKLTIYVIADDKSIVWYKGSSLQLYEA